MTEDHKKLEIEYEKLKIKSDAQEILIKETQLQQGFIKATLVRYDTIADLVRDFDGESGNYEQDIVFRFRIIKNIIRSFDGQ